VFPFDEATIWERRDRVIFLRATAPHSKDRRLAEEASGDDVPVLLDALVQMYGDLLSERYAIDETMDATDNELFGTMWTRVRSEHAAAKRGFGKVRHHG
jgi:hypothetical protein